MRVNAPRTPRRVVFRGPLLVAALAAVACARPGDAGAPRASPDGARRPAHAHAGPAPRAFMGAAAMLADIHRDNAAFVEGHAPEHFRPFAEEQHPRVVIIGCSDSRFHVEAMDRTPDGDVFEVRNIGNQVDTAEGSVEYAVEHLHVPLLMVVGHVGCGAVRAAMEDYAAEPPALRRELNGLHLSVARVPGQGVTEERWRTAVVANVHEQVREALREYRAHVEAGELHVVGAVYDFRGEMADAPGRVVVVNVDGETDPQKLRDMPLARAAGLHP